MDKQGEIVVKRKVITLCGSVRFWDKIQEMSGRLEFKAKGIDMLII